MKNFKRVLSLLLSLMLVLGAVAVGGTVALADDGRVTVNVEFGADHKGYARRYFGSVDGFTVSGSTVSFEVDASATVFDVESDFTESLFEYAPDPHDKSMKRMDSLGLNPIEEYSDGNEYASEEVSGNVTDGMTFYILWQKPASVRAVVKSPEIGSEITFVNNYAAGGGNASPTSSPAPSIYVYGNAVLFRSPFHEYTDGFWCDNAEGNWVYGYPYSGFFTGTVAENETYYARFELESDFGYYIDKTSVDNIIVNNGVPFAFKDSFSVNAAVTATDSVPVYIIPDKYDCYPGDTVNYTVYMGSVKDFGGIQLKLDIPQGLTFDDYALADNLSSTLNVGGYGSVSFNESNKQLLGFGCDYSSDAPTALMTFSCTVDEDAQGDAEISAPLCLISDKNASEIPSGYYSALSCVTITSADAETYSVSDTLYYGTYPQSGVTDETTVAALNEKLTDDGWVSYGYYSGTGTKDDGNMVPSDYMNYQDVVLDGVKYRAVTFDTYRPYYTGYTTSTSVSTYQDDNGYTYGNVYWFKFEPIEWRVLDPESGLVMCETIIDSQPYNNYLLNADSEYWGDSGKTYYASNYAKSNIRDWLNSDFYNTAFSDEQKLNIKTTTLNNDGYYTLTGTTGYEKYDAPSTNDKVFLLSYDEASNDSYGFSTSYSNYDSSRQAKGSDYAKCLGLYVYNSSGRSYDGCSNWRLRSPGFDSYFSCYVYYDGYVDYNYYTSHTYDGIRPALKLQNLESDPTGVPVYTEVEIPEGIEESYNGTEYTGVEAGEGYTLTGTVKATDAGEYTATATLEDGYIWSDGTIEAKEISWKINPRLIWYTAEARLDTDSFVYDGTAKEPELAFLKDSYIQKELVEGVDYRIVHKEWKNNINASDPDEEDVEKLPTALFAIEGMGNYYHSTDQYLIFSIEKADPEVTAPVPVEGLKADGTEKELVTPGSTTGGTLEYSLNGENYSAEIPEASEEGTYTVYYRVAGDENYNDAAAETVSAAIGESIHTVTYIVDGEEFAQFYVSFGQPVPQPETPQKDGFDFIGWDAEIPEAMPAENLTITALFEAIPEPEEPTPTEPTPTEPTPTEPTPTEPTPTDTEPAHEHDYKGEVTKEPTCTEDGIMTYTCECGESYTQAIPKTGHKPGEWTVVTPATTKAAGKEVKKCEVCGETIAEREIAKLEPQETDAGIVSVNLEKTNAFGIANAFGVNPEKIPAGSTVTWYVNGEKAGEGNGFRVDNPTENYTIKAVVTNRDGKVIGETEEVTVKVNNCFFARLYYWLCRIIQKVIDLFKGIGK